MHKTNNSDLCLTGRTNVLCILCEEEHSLRVCPRFRQLSIQERVDFVFKNNYCNNCLSMGHIKSNCQSKNTCLHCKKTHHSLLHKSFSTKSSNLVDEKSSDLPSSQKKTLNESNQAELPSTSQVKSYSAILANHASNNANVLLRTAMVQIDHLGQLFTIRALIDSGSQRSFLSDKITNRLGLITRKSHFEVSGIGGHSQTSTQECEIVLFSGRYNLLFNVTAIILPKVTNIIPSSTFDVPTCTNLSDLDLADPNFNVSNNRDLILGNDCERHINLEGIKRNICGEASAYNTVFGWVLIGPINISQIQTFTTSVTPTGESSMGEVSLSETLKRFWEQEEVPSAPTLSPEDNYCEQFFNDTTIRLPDGRYMVRLPFKKEYPLSISLGPSRFSALCQYSRMEQNLVKKPELHSQYNAVLSEYLSLNHMEETTSSEIFSNDTVRSFYLPHHAVLLPDSKTTKVRVVFNASRKTKSGFSLNDVLYMGSTLQSDLIGIILNWRTYEYVFSGDIQQMYRQILIHPDDRPFQRILYQNSPQEPVKDYQLKTVTFGVNCAPFLAIRTLHRLAFDSEKEFSKAAYILRNEAYVDDILSGGHSVEEALQSQNELLCTLKSAGFVLKKNTSNDSRLLSHLAPDDLYDSNLLRFYDTSSTKTLGIHWNALMDSFTYSFSTTPVSAKATKRQVLSSVAKLFDPTGWLSPVIIRSKILIQQLWLEGSDWDEPISPDSQSYWNLLLQDLLGVENIRIPRWINFRPSDNVQIHGFCDASTQAYCATIYVRVQTAKSVVFSNLLVAKSKVSPIQPVRLPRLELCGAVTLARLVSYVLNTLNFCKSEITLWSDSSIVLGWLSKPPQDGTNSSTCA